MKMENGKCSTHTITAPDACVQTSSAGCCDAPLATMQERRCHPMGGNRTDHIDFLILHALHWPQLVFYVAKGSSLLTMCSLFDNAPTANYI